ncbi:MAG TPA: hypothetical protein DCY48_02740 [Candidatus Magasanikbacteria bacterium]|nr:MAG: hypothetical protein A3I74_02100 [Candidatus Magasanikbacteria bacterium RIFCSPLOWO2_02_FULL_47_16]OGH79693.1 MAG: hypothetical protein A3C10_01305 [Candidatus Magasanikbacteria bacterium RIFCSPHIGHO2_02_FULL_48_18]HAZ28669.1 hypothetical protein [Candidatus Magasanikbacteria bacterium]
MHLLQRFTFSLSFFSFLALFFFIGVAATYAAPDMVVKDSAYQARYVSQSVPDPVTMTVGETKTVIVRFKNTGTASWNASGARFVSAFTVEPKYRASSFFSGNQTKSITTKTEPGAVAELPVTLTATKAGTFREPFFLAAENYTWIDGGYFYLDIVVSPAAPSNTPLAPPQDNENSEKTPDAIPASNNAKKLYISQKSVSATGGDSIPIVAGFRNTGSAEWTQYRLLALSSGSSFAESSWKSQSVVLDETAHIPPNGILRTKFSFRALAKKGTYAATFVLEVNGTRVDTEPIILEVNVVEDAPFGYDAPVVSQDEEFIATARLAEEPIIRVGLWENPKTVRAVFEDDTRVMNGGAEAGILPKSTAATLTSDGGLFRFVSDAILFDTANPIRLVPVNDPHAVFTLPDFERTVSWKKGISYNQYRGVLEYNRGKTDGKPWVINETLLEDYVAGVAETGNTSPSEYQKALVTAARTYAYYLKTCNCKYGIFDVVPSTADQLFLGYKSEVDLPNIAAAAQQTRGFMVTYDTDLNTATPNDAVITPYFSQTDGRTRAWQEVWGGKAKPWLVSVVATYDKRDGKAKWGHGVGMSNRDAIIRAKEGGASWKEILQYYYTGVAVEKMYQ